MANVLPINFPLPSEQAIASYNFIEFASGFGIAELYLGKTIDKNLISTNTFYSHSVKTQVNMGASSNALRMDEDYDIEIKTPLTIEGTAIVNAGIGIDRSASANSAYFVFKIRKYDGSTETEIANNQSNTHTNNSVVGWTYLYTATDLEIPKTTFKIGDILRLTVEVWGAGGADPAYVAYGHDPVNRDIDWDSSGEVPSLFKLNLPIKINL